MQDKQQENFEQEFIASLKKQENDSVQPSKGTRNKHILIIVAVVGVVVALIGMIMLGVMLVNNDNDGGGDGIIEGDAEVNAAFSAETSILEVMVSPGSARVLIDEELYSNGKYEMQPGEYEFAVEADGFKPYTGTVIVADKHKSYVTACLQPIEGNENYYDNNDDDRWACQFIWELEPAAAGDQNTLVDGIFKYTPYHNDDDGYYVDPYFDEDGNVIVELTFKDCSQTEAVLEERAYAWMEEQGFDRFDYTFEKTWDCEG
ncbi:hypothetical protein IJG22_01155 [Candidatus Saccharibacteria bacterium]|nr:hypothetical protein [Candidatus Saccharibacteria bacterium]